MVQLTTLLIAVLVAAWMAALVGSLRVLAAAEEAVWLTAVSGRLGLSGDVREEASRGRLSGDVRAKNSLHFAYFAQNSGQCISRKPLGNNDLRPKTAFGRLAQFG